MQLDRTQPTASCLPLPYAHVYQGTIKLASFPPAISICFTPAISMMQMWTRCHLKLASVASRKGASNNNT
eukprot:357149-Pelagomonas_calceolata.AAC.1